MIRDNKATQQFIKFAIIGGLNTVVDALVYWLLTSYANIPFGMAKVISYIAGMVNSWGFNSKWTFKDTGDNSKDFRKMAKFLLINLAAMLLQIGILAFFKKVFDNTSVFVSLFIATPASLILNFIGNKLIVFGDKK